MKGTLSVMFALTSAVSMEDDDASCVFEVPSFRGKTHLIRKNKQKTQGNLSQKSLSRRAKKKERQRQIAAARDSINSQSHIYDQSDTIYVKDHGRLEKIEDRFSDIKVNQWEDAALHGAHKEGNIAPKSLDWYNLLIMWYKSKHTSKTIKKKVSWADEKKKKFIHYIPARKPYNCYLTHRDCFMRMKCYCMLDDPSKKPLMNAFCK